jgi:peroxiredoxin (alkyl hydroperoxide reductase subunit C)
MVYNNDLHTNNIVKTDCITLGRIAPDFTASSTQGPITLSQYRGKWVVLFYEPGDFSPTATSELIAFAQLQPEFEKRNVQLIGVTIDSNLADIDWLFDILQYTGIKITFPLISDRNAEVARLYDIVNPDRIYEVSVRDAFIISPAQNIRAIISYPISCGLNIYEMLRVIDSLQTTDQFNVYTPSNWMPGDPVLVRAPQTFEEAIQMWNSQEGLEISCSMWYYCYRYLNSNNNPGSNNTNL